MTKAAQKGKTPVRMRSGKYVGDVYIPQPNGSKPQRKTKGGFNTAAEARAWERQILDEAAKGVDVLTAEKMTVSQLFERYIQLKTETGKAPGTIKTLYNALHRIEPYLGHYTLAKLTAPPIDDLRKLLLKEVAPSTAHLYLVCLRGALNWAVKQGVLSVSVANRSDLPSVKKKAIDLPEHSVMREIIAQLSDRKLHHGVLAYTLAHTGMRRGEALRCRWEDFHQTPEGWTLRVRGSKSDSSSRTITIDDELMAVINQLRDRQLVGSGLVFVDREGVPVDAKTFQVAVQQVSQRLGIRVWPHLFRHYHVSSCIEAGMSMHDISLRVGHANLGITFNIYAHRRVNADRDTSARASAIMRGEVARGNTESGAVVTSLVTSAP